MSLGDLSLSLHDCIPYSRKYWWSLNLAVWLQTKHKKYWRNLNLAVAPRSVLRHYKHCERVYQGVLPSSRLRYLNKAVSLQIYKKYNLQHANDKVAICTACVERRRAGPRALLHALCHYTLRAKIILADFNLAVSTPTAKPPNLNPRHNFPAIRYVELLHVCMYVCMYVCTVDLEIFVVKFFSGLHIKTTKIKNMFYNG